MGGAGDNQRTTLGAYFQDDVPRRHRGLLQQNLSVALLSYRSFVHKKAYTNLSHSFLHNSIIPCYSSTWCIFRLDGLANFCTDKCLVMCSPELFPAASLIGHVCALSGPWLLHIRHRLCRTAVLVCTEFRVKLLEINLLVQDSIATCKHTRNV